jgi:outer membrane protein assembly factor BamB
MDKTIVGVVSFFIAGSLLFPISSPLYVQHPVSEEGPMDSPWSIFGHDVKHTGRSPYSTIDNYGGVKWTFRTDPPITTSPILDEEGNIYFTSWRYLYALYPNGTEIWRWEEHHDLIESDPVISDDGTIYIGDDGGMVYAFSLNGTLKWTYEANEGIKCAITLDEENSIYFCTYGFPEYGTFYALYPNGTLKWSYPADYYCRSNPAISDDGTIYFTSDFSLYAFYLNGTLKWKNTLGSTSVYLGSPAIGDDGTIYIPRESGPLYAFYPNGTLKWTCDSVSSLRTPAIAADGTIYVGGGRLYAVYPTNGTLKWVAPPGVQSIGLAIGNEGTIYMGVFHDDQNCYITAMNPDGTERWRLWISDQWAYSSPIIGEDGTVYIGSTWYDNGMLYAINGKMFDAPVIEKPKQNMVYLFNFKTKLPMPNWQGYAFAIGRFTFKVSHPDPQNVSRIEFYQDGMKMFEDTTPPYEWVWPKRCFPIGADWIMVVAVNKTGMTNRAPIIEMLKIF